MDEYIRMKRLAFAKYLIFKGDNETEKSTPLSSVALLHYHDSLEILFNIILKDKDEEFNINKNKTFIDLFIRINELLDEDKKSNQKGHLTELNLFRKNLKHKGIFVSREDIEKSKYTANSTFKELCEKFYGYSYDNISLSYLIKNEKIVNTLNGAINSFQNNKTDTINKLAKSFKYLLDEYQVKEFNNTNFFCNLDQYEDDVNKEFIEEIDGFFSDIINHVDSINDNMNILSLGLNYKKYILFRKLIPNKRAYPSPIPLFGENKNHYEDSDNVFSEKDLAFCENFIVESALQLQEL